MEPVTRVAVTVTFMRMDARPAEPAPPLPDGAIVTLVPTPTVPFYRYLYDTVGAPYLWWMRRTEPAEQLQGLMLNRSWGLFVLYIKSEPAGFFELDGRRGPDINLSYFGLLPHAVGRGMGDAFLRRAVDTAWGFSPPGITVNTCNADHPRAMPAYRRIGFEPVRAVDEVWNIPDRLGLRIPDHLRA